MGEKKKWRTAISFHRGHEAYVRGYKLEDFIGNLTFTEAIYLVLKGELPTEREAKMLDAIFVSVVEHSIAPPSVIAARAVTSGVNPMNVGVGAGVLAFGEAHGGALEGALKLKEIAYIHAEGYPAGEMKHGPIALIDENMPVIALAPKDRVYEKMVSNIEEVLSRKGRVIAVGFEGDKLLQEKSETFIGVPQVAEDLTPFVTVVPLQLLAYHIADQLGLDVDQPRNLAKTVTVE